MSGSSRSISLEALRDNPMVRLQFVTNRHGKSINKYAYGYRSTNK